MRTNEHVLEDDIEELRDLLAQEEDRAESLERLVAENLSRAEEAEANAGHLDAEMQLLEQEVSMLRVSSTACADTTHD